MQDIHIFDFDGSITAQSSLMHRFAQRLKVHALQADSQAARLWTSPKQYAQISQKMAISPGFSLMGSGDYHHWSLALIRQIKTPITVVLFDNHPDWMQPPHQYHCGTWVYSLARLAQVNKIIVIGLESGDINGANFAKGDVESFNQGKIVFFPYQPVEIAPTSDTKRQLNSALAADLSAGIAGIMDAISTEHVYISVDKDCLQVRDAYTNWEQGSLPLATVLACMQAIHARFKVIGADTVGDYSPPRFISPLKWIGSLLDRPANAFRLRRLSQDVERNQFANIALLNVFFPDA